MRNDKSGSVEIWGGFECTINRIGDTYRDQFHETGHYDRSGDLRLLSDLGIRTVRYPLLWEKHEPVQGVPIDWTWANHQLGELRQLEITPVIGLVHHGSGPLFTDLLDNQFPDKLALYATAVARQFPWIEYYTPVNEPLTTARFSGLYGIWYPHKTDDHSFLQMLVNQVKAIVLCMQAIREINPAAKLVQTEDLTMTHGTAKFNDQVRFENERRWLTMDLLLGKVDEHHPLWRYFTDNGVTKEQLDFFIQHPTPPDVVGWNYYVTSERFIGRPTTNSSGTAKVSYKDHVAVRRGKALGLKVLLTQAATRYPLPVAITECHLSCTREEQLRWLHEAWISCNALKQEGVDIRGLTVWSLLGAMDWDSLLTENRKSYESGAFEIGNGDIRPTAVATFIRLLTLRSEVFHPLLKARGWWNRIGEPTNGSDGSDGIPPIILTGNYNEVAVAIERACRIRSIAFVWLKGSLAKMVGRYESQYNQLPWGVIIAPGMDPEKDVQECLLAGIEYLVIPPAPDGSVAGYGYLSRLLDLFIDRQFAVLSGLEQGNSSLTDGEAAPAVLNLSR